MFARSVLVAAGCAWAGLVGAAPLVAVTGDSMLRFDSLAPGSVTAKAITGFLAGDSIVGLDRRPATAQVVLLTRNGAGVARLYVLDAVSGAAQHIATLTADPSDLTQPFTELSGSHFGVDFNPVADRIRVVSDTGGNMRVNPNNGLVTTDTPLNPGNPRIVGVAYTNNVSGALSTTLYGIDSDNDALYIQNPPNNGTLTLVGALGTDAGDRIAFDIADQPATNRAYAAMETAGSTGLYSIDLVTGQAALLGLVGGSPTILGMAVTDALPLIFSDGFE